MVEEFQKYSPGRHEVENEFRDQIVAAFSRSLPLPTIHIQLRTWYNKMSVEYVKRRMLTILDSILNTSWIEAHYLTAAILADAQAKEFYVTPKFENKWTSLCSTSSIPIHQID